MIDGGTHRAQSNGYLNQKGSFFNMLPIEATTNSPDKRELKLLLESLNFGLLITGLGIWKEP